MKENRPLVDGPSTSLVVTSHFHWVAVVCLVAGIAVIAVLACWFRKCRHGSRYQYTALDGAGSNRGALGALSALGSLGGSRDSGGSAGSVELGRQVRDHALALCRGYLRASSRYELLQHLYDIGWRPDKHWFIVNDSSVKTERLLTLFGAAPSSKSITTSVALEVFRALQHPYIHPVLDLEILDEKNVLLVVPFNPAGSLKDLIYSSCWSDDWAIKYSSKGDPLPLPQVQRLGRQILEALVFLKERGFPPFAHLHSGNVILQNGVARLAGLENTLLGLQPRPAAPGLASSSPVTSSGTSTDVICFGHVLFEMAAGYELAEPKPTPGHLQLDLERCPQVADVLDVIFNSSSPVTVEELLLCELFRHIDLREMRGASVFRRRGLASPTKQLLHEIARSASTVHFSREPRESPPTSLPASPLALRDRRVTSKAAANSSDAEDEFDSNDVDIVTDTQRLLR